MKVLLIGLVLLLVVSFVAVGCKNKSEQNDEYPELEDLYKGAGMYGKEQQYLSGEWEYIQDLERRIRLLESNIEDIKRQTGIQFTKPFP